MIVHRFIVTNFVIECKKNVTNMINNNKLCESQISCDKFVIAIKIV